MEYWDDGEEVYDGNDDNCWTYYNKFPLFGWSKLDSGASWDPDGPSKVWVECWGEFDSSVGSHHRQKLFSTPYTQYLP